MAANVLVTRYVSITSRITGWNAVKGRMLVPSVNSGWLADFACLKLTFVSEQLGLSGPGGFETDDQIKEVYVYKLTVKAEDFEQVD
jgi:hypothetical protein